MKWPWVHKKMDGREPLFKYSTCNIVLGLLQPHKGGRTWQGMLYKLMVIIIAVGCYSTLSPIAVQTTINCFYFSNTPFNNPITPFNNPITVINCDAFENNAMQILSLLCILRYLCTAFCVILCPVTSVKI